MNITYKIVFFSQQFPNKYLPYRGIFNFQAVKSLISKGHDLRVIAPVGINPPKSFLFPPTKISNFIKHLYKFLTLKEIEYKQIKVIYPRTIVFANRFLWKYNPFLLKIFSGNRINKLIMDFKPDIIITSFINPAALYIKYLKTKYDFKAISIMIGSDILIHPSKYYGWKKFEKIINTNINFNICVSNNMLKFVRKYRNIKNLYVIPNGYDATVFKYYVNNSKKDVANKLISVGSFYATKGQDILLMAFLSLNKEFSLTLVGDGPMATYLKNFVSRNNLSNRVKFTGRVENLYEVLIRHDLFVLPSRSEGLPVAPLEAMACGLPVVASNVGGVNEIIIEKFNGLLFKSESIIELTKQIEIASKIQWNKREIANWVKNNFSWNVWADKLIKLLS